MLQAEPIRASGLRLLRDTILVTDLESGIRRSAGGILIPDDNMKNQGIRARWCKAWRVGPDAKNIEPGNWLLVEHGRWTLGIDLVIGDEEVRVWSVEYRSVMMATDVPPAGSVVDLADARQRYRSA